ncbi:MAG: PQQ-binding-like beta-propeller repeat protein [Phycisphaeraceae bacterium]
MKQVLPLFALLLTTSIALAEGNWPQWQGPDRTGLSKESGLLKKWPDAGPRKVWTFDGAGLGYSSFAVVGDRLYTLGSRGKESLICVNITNGKEVWNAEIGEHFTNKWGDGPRGTPTVAGGFVYAMGGKGDLICVSVKDGKVAWSKSLTKDLGGSIPGWGYTESVLVDGDKVLCTPGGRKGAIAALSATTGEVIWQSKDFTDGAQYSSIIVAEHGGKRQYIQITMNSVVGIEAESGKLLWRSDWPGKTAVIPSPIFHDGHVFVTSGYGVGCKLIQLSDDNKATEVYTNKTIVNHHGGVILVGDHLYGHSDTEGWVCMEFKTGKKVWNEKRGVGKGSIGYADGMLYCLGERSGEVALVEASPTGYNEVSRFKLEPQSKQRSNSGGIWSHPTITGGRLYLRDQEFLSSYDVSDNRTN